MSHRGSILCLPTGIWAWPVTKPDEITEESLARVFGSGVELFMLGTGKQPWFMPESSALALSRRAHRARGDPDGRCGAHLQHPVWRAPQGRSRADRGRLSAPLRYLAGDGRELSSLRGAGPRGRQGSLPRDAVRSRRQARAAVCALCLQCRDRERPRAGTRAHAGRNPPAMVARRDQWRADGRGSRQPHCGGTDRHRRAVLTAEAAAARPDRGSCVRFV